MIKGKYDLLDLVDMKFPELRENHMNRQTKIIVSVKEIQVVSSYKLFDFYIK